MLGGRSVNLDRTIGASVGSRATSSAMNKASRVSSGANTPRPTQVRSESNIISPASRRNIHSGSSAGLNVAKPAHITMSNSGYLNPANQTARLKNRSHQVDASVKSRVMNQRTNNRIFESRLTKSDKSSISLMNKRSAR